MILMFYQGVIVQDFRGRQVFPGKNAPDGCGDAARRPMPGTGGTEAENREEGSGVAAVLDALFVRVHAIIGFMHQIIETGGIGLPDMPEGNAARIGAFAVLLQLVQLAQEDILMNFVADEDEFVATDAENIVAAKISREDAAHVYNEFISLVMAVSIVDVLEIVEINKDDADILHGPGREGVAGDAVGIAIAQSGQRIAEAEIAQFVGHACP